MLMSVRGVSDTCTIFCVCTQGGARSVTMERSLKKQLILMHLVAKNLKQKVDCSRECASITAMEHPKYTNGSHPICLRGL